MSDEKLEKGTIQIKETKAKKIVADIQFTDGKNKNKSLSILGQLEKKHLEYNGKEVLFLRVDGCIKEVFLSENNTPIFIHNPSAVIPKKEVQSLNNSHNYGSTRGNFGGSNNQGLGLEIATAPYNFVPLPERVLFPDYQAKHDRPVGGLDGEIELEIETLTPMFIRDGQKLGDNNSDNSNFFRDANGFPLIPGSSLRGLVRNLVEIISYSKMTQVTNEHLFYRSVGNDKVGKHYCSQFVQTCGVADGGHSWKNNEYKTVRANIHEIVARAGFVKKRGNDWYIEECSFARVDHETVRRGIGSSVHNKGLPNEDLQNKEFFVEVDSKAKDYFFPEKERGHGNMYLRMRKVHEISKNCVSDKFVKGKLIITGNIPGKHIEFVFFPQKKLNDFKIPPEKLKRFNDEDQITQWQKDTDPNKTGKLCDNDPVFFLIEKDDRTVKFFGRAQLFRLPYDLSPIDLVPENLRNGAHDLSELLFGTVSQDDKKEAVKGRVRFGDAKAVAIEQEKEFYENSGKPITPHILASPKPTCVSHYLEQKGVSHKSNYFSYISQDKSNTVLRGHKLYWHRWDKDKDLGQVIDNSAPANSTQHTKMRVLKKGVSFKAVIRFDNLHAIELGALLAALKLPEGCAHKIGMGKSLGLGSIKIKPKLRVYEHKKRYSSFVESGVSEKDNGEYLAAFQSAVIEHVKNTSAAHSKQLNSLEDILRLKYLYKLLNWGSRPEPDKTRYLELRVFRNKPVLPDPFGV